MDDLANFINLKLAYMRKGETWSAGGIEVRCTGSCSYIYRITIPGTDSKELPCFGIRSMAKIIYNVTKAMTKE